MMCEYFATPWPVQAATTDWTMNAAYYQKILKKSLVHDLIFKHNCVMYNWVKSTSDFFHSPASTHTGKDPPCSQNSLYSWPWFHNMLQTFIWYSGLCWNDCITWRFHSCISTNFHKSQTCSIGFKCGDWSGHWSTLKTYSWNQSKMTCEMAHYHPGNWWHVGWTVTVKGWISGIQQCSAGIKADWVYGCWCQILTMQQKLRFIRTDIAIPIFNSQVFINLFLL